jgi:hypothetical protein
MGNVLLAFPLVRRRAIAAGLLLLLLAELLHKLLDLSALLGVVAPGVVHRAPQPALITARGLVRSLVTAWAVTPTNRCGNSGGSGSPCQQLVIVGLFFFLILLLPLL